MKVRLVDLLQRSEVRELGEIERSMSSSMFVSVPQVANGEGYREVYRYIGKDAEGTLILSACPPAPGVPVNWKYGYLPCGHRNDGAGEHIPGDSSEVELVATTQVLQQVPPGILAMMADQMLSAEMRRVHDIESSLRRAYKHGLSRGVTIGIIIVSVIHVLISFFINGVP